MVQNIEAEILGLAVMTSNALGWKTRLAGHIGTYWGHLDADCGIVATCEEEYVTAITQYAELLENMVREALDMEELSEADREGLASFGTRLGRGYDPDDLASAAREDWGRILASVITDRIRAWDGEDCRSLQDVLRDALQMKRELLEEDGDSYRAEDLMEAVYLALADVATRDDAPWPSPWNKDGGQDFAEVCDRRRQYIHTDWRDCNLRDIYSHSYVYEWESGVNCEFD